MRGDRLGVGILPQESERKVVESPVGNDEEATDTRRKRGQRLLQEDVVESGSPGRLASATVFDEPDEHGSLVGEQLAVRLQTEDANRLPGRP